MHHGRDETMGKRIGVDRLISGNWDGLLFLSKWRSDGIGTRSTNGGLQIPQ